MGDKLTVTVPDLGDFKSVDVVDVLVQIGDRVELETPLATLETEKATMDVPSTAVGRVVDVIVKRGDKVAAGSAVVVLDVEAETPAVSPPSNASSAPVQTVQPAVAAAPVVVAPVQTFTPPAAPAAMAVVAPTRSQVTPGRVPVEDVGFARSYASPSVRLLARELGVDLARLTGSGPKGRITHDDVKQWVKQALSSGMPAAAAGGGALPRVPEVDHAKFGPISVEPLTRIQRISGPRLHASWVNLPHVTQFDEADITAMEAARLAHKAAAQARGIKLTPLAFVIRACVRALQKYPRFNASLDSTGTNLVLKHYIHIGFAADTPQGLVVPVLKDADKKDIYEIAGDLASLSEKARNGKLTAADMQGGTFTISSLGGIGGTAFTPIINAPEVAILGVSKSSMKPVYMDGQFVPRLMLPLSLSYDHRVIDGASAARFTTELGAALADVTGLVEAIP